jgi:hypothetical protein
MEFLKKNPMFWFWLALAAFVFEIIWIFEMSEWLLMLEGSGLRKVSGSIFVAIVFVAGPLASLLAIWKVPNVLLKVLSFLLLSQFLLLLWAQRS